MAPLARALMALLMVLCAKTGTVWADKPVPTQSTFIAAVYEYTAVFPFPPSDSITRDQALEIMNNNLDAYEVQAEIAAKQGADIILFPEIGLYGYGFSRAGLAPYTEPIPDPHVSWNPCVSPWIKYTPHDVQTRLSCMARKNGIYLAANMASQYPCSSEADAKCPSDGKYYYNTNVIYNTEGVLIAKYHKRRLYLEPAFNYADPAEEVYFDTPFGRIGIFTCFDILFKDPAVDLIEKHSIDTILFPTAWVEIELISSISSIGVHSGFARRMGVNLLAANINLITPFTCSGSGIYAPNGTVTFFRQLLKEESKLVIGTIESTPKFAPLNYPAVTISGGESEFRSYVGEINADLYNFVRLSGDAGIVNVCQGTMCCRADYSIRNRNKEDLYALGAFDGLHANSIWYMQQCILLKCADGKDQSTCGMIISTTSTQTRFSRLHLTGQFDSDYTVPFVVVGNDGNTGLSSDTWDFDGTSILASHGLSEPLIIAAIYARPFERDIPWNNQQINLVKHDRSKPAPDNVGEYVEQAGLPRGSDTEL